MRVHRWVFLCLLFIAFAVGGYFIAKHAGSGVATVPRPTSPPPDPLAGFDNTPRTFGSGERPKVTISRDSEALDQGAIAGQRSIVFTDRESMERFLSKIKGKGFSVLGRIDALNALRIGFLSAAELAALLDGSEQTGFIFPVVVPGLPDGTVQPGAIPLGNGLASWLGIAAYDRSTWGNGVLVAVLDTGVSPSSSMFSRTRQISLVDLPTDLSTLNGHGTAVTSLINQVAPDASFLSVRIADDNGISNSFLIAQGILAAVDGGAKIINISMGGDGYSSILQNAVDYAQERGVVIIAAAGNNGINQIAQPAAMTGVIPVMSVDAVGDHLLFSNTGSTSAYSAPGYAVNAEGVDGGIVSFTGTSASAPIAAGTLAAVMSNNVNKSVTATQGVELINSNLNEAGAPGADGTFGGGLLDLGRVMQSSTAGIVDAAVASQWIVSDTNGLTLQVTVQNQGTAPLFNVPVQVTTSTGTQTMNVGSLTAGKIQTFNVPVPATAESVTFQSSIGVSSGQSDVNPANNRRVDVYTPPAAQ
jgi:hypothetical protein